MYLVNRKSRSVLGSLYLADIGVPDVLHEELVIEVEPTFIHDSIIRLYDPQGEIHR